MGGGGIVDRDLVVIGDDVVPDDKECGELAVPGVVFCGAGADLGDAVVSGANDVPSGVEVCVGVVDLSVVLGVVGSPAVVRGSVVDLGVVTSTGGKHMQFT